MSEQTIILVGGPDSGKTNFLARLWESLRTQAGKLVCPTPPDDIKYVEEALSHLLQGDFAPRSDRNVDEGRSDVTIPVRRASAPADDVARLVVPDITGELWTNAVETLEMTTRWMDDLKKSSGAILFVRVLSDLNVTPLDWVTARGVLRREISLTKDGEQLPTQVMLSELLRFLEISLQPRSDGSPPRVAVLVTAWDRLDRHTAAAGPSAFLHREYPLFAGKLRHNTRLHIKTFGVSVVGGDLNIDAEFRQRFLEGDIANSGYVIADEDGSIRQDRDITVPMAWLLGDLEPKP
jgi:hypothetical protein